MSVAEASIAPEVLYEGEGITIKRNPKNRFVVVSLFYWADPAKRSEEWKQESQFGMHPSKWRKEYLIDYEALAGVPVFPEVAEHRDKIIVQPPYPEFNTDQPYWGGFDYGMRNVSSFHIYTIYDGVMYVIWEMYEPCQNVVEFCERMRACPYYPKLRYIAADPTMWGNRFHDLKTGAPASPYDEFIAQGVHKFIKGNDDEVAWLTTMRRHWADPEKITFRIFSCCPNLIRELQKAVYPTVSEQVSARTNDVEKIRDKYNHAMDDCKYFMNSQPSVPLKGWTYRNVADSYNWPGGRSPAPSNPAVLPSTFNKYRSMWTPNKRTR